MSKLPGERVQEKRHRGPSPFLAAVEADQEEKRDQRELEEDVEEDHVEAREEPEQPGLKRQQEARSASPARSVTDSHDAKTAVIIKSEVSSNSQRLIPSSPRANRMSLESGHPAQPELTRPIDKAEG